jgi:putative membrane protein
MDSERFKNFLGRWLISILAVLIAEHVVPGIRYDAWTDLLVATLVLGFLNNFIKPVLLLFSLPILVLTLGLFTLVINALLLLIVSYIVSGFHVDGFGAAFWGALVISIATIILNILTGMSSTNIKVRKSDEKNHNQNGNDDIIDV